MQIVAGGMPSTANEKSISRSVSELAFPPPLVCELHLSATCWISASCLSTSFFSLCICPFLVFLSLSLSPFLSLGILFTVFDLGIPFLPKQTKQPQTSLNCSPQCAHTHTCAHTHSFSLSLLLITHRKWAPMQTRPAWPVEPRMEFQALKCSPVEEIEHELSSPFFSRSPSFPLLFYPLLFLSPFLLPLWCCAMLHLNASGLLWNAAIHTSWWRVSPPLEHWWIASVPPLFEPSKYVASGWKWHLEKHVCLNYIYIVLAVLVSL